MLGRFQRDPSGEQHEIQCSIVQRIVYCREDQGDSDKGGSTGTIGKEKRSESGKSRQEFWCSRTAPVQFEIDRLVSSNLFR